MVRLIESASELEKYLPHLLSEELIGLDTETYGKGFQKHMFSLQLVTGSEQLYLNFHDYGDGQCMNRYEAVRILSPLWQDSTKTLAIHNAKFDLRRLSILDVYPQCKVHCTQMNARFEYNQHIAGYSLANCAKRIGQEKLKIVEEYIKEHKLYDEDGEPCFWKVPKELMVEYGIHDAYLARELAIHQRDLHGDTIYYKNDLEFQKVLHKMEVRGMLVREEYAQKGLAYERTQQQIAEHKLTQLAGEPFRAGPLWLRKFFDTNGVQYQINPETGNPIFDKAALSAIQHPAADLIRQYRRHEKYASTYYEHYTKYPVVHAFIKPFGTDTGRLSYEEPNLQNVPKEEELDESIPFQVRGCFQPREDHCFVFIDFDQQEFRVLLDYAGEHDLIHLINTEGADVHQATADAVGITRKQAKTLNFGLLYGMGEEKLAATLKVDILTARSIRGQYFAKLPRVQNIIERMIAKAKRDKVVRTWIGRPLYFPNKEFAYAAPNHIIQGGCGDIARLAMVPIDEYLTKKKVRSAMLVQVHDELVFEIHKNELDVVPGIVEIMQNTYKPFNKMNLTCGVEHSWVSWGKRDIVKGYPK